MSAPDPKVVALLAEHELMNGNTAAKPKRRFASTIVCRCGHVESEVYDTSYADLHAAHVAQVFADAGIGDVGSRNVAMDLIHEADEQRERAERADARVAAVAASVLALADEADARPGGPGCPTPHWVDTDSLRAAVESADVVASGTQAFSPAALARVKAEERERIAQAIETEMRADAFIEKAEPEWSWFRWFAARIAREAGDPS